MSIDNCALNLNIPEQKTTDIKKLAAKAKRILEGDKPPATEFGEWVDSIHRGDAPEALGDWDIRNGTIDQKSAMYATIWHKEQEQNQADAYRISAERAAEADESIRNGGGVGKALSFLSFITNEVKSRISAQAIAKIKIEEILTKANGFAKISKLADKGGKDEAFRPLIKEYFNEDTGNELAITARKEMLDIENDIVDSKNKAAGVEGLFRKLEGFIPHQHNAEVMVRIGKDEASKLIQQHFVFIDDETGADITDQAAATVVENIIKNDNHLPSFEQNRVLRAKSANDWIAYHQAMNIPIKDVFMRYWKRQTAQLGLIDVMGIDVNNWYKTVREAIRESGSTYGGFVKKMSVFDAAFAHATGQVYARELPHYSEGDNIIKRNKERIVQTLGDVRRVGGAFVLQNAAFSVLMDLSNHMLRQNAMGLPAFTVWQNAFRTFRGGREQMKEILALNGLALDSALMNLRDASLHFGDMGEAGWANKLQVQFYKWSGFTWAGDQMKASWQIGKLSDITKLLKDDWDNLRPETKEVLSEFAFNKQVWKRIQETHTTTTRDWGGASVEMLDTMKLPDDVQRVVRHFLLSEGQMIAGNSNYVIDAFIYGGAARGTFERELRESVFQFARFPVMQTYYTIMPMFSREALSTGDRARMVAAYLLTSAALGYAKFQLFHLMKNGEPAIPEDDDEAQRQLMVSLTYGGALGIIGGLMFKPDEWERGAGAVPSLLSSPTLSALDEIQDYGADIAEIPLDLLVGDDPAYKSWKADPAKILQTASPLWWSDMIIHNALAEQGMYMRNINGE